MTKAEWIILRYDVQPNELICERCGHKALAPMPCGFKEATEMMDAFAKIHRKCKPKEEEISDKKIEEFVASQQD